MKIITTHSNSNETSSELAEYDSTLDTFRHSRRVDQLLLETLTKVQERITKHDLSKMEPPEKETFDEATPRLRTLTYGSDEYKASLDSMGEALKHHYANNRHHPEHFSNGIDGMTLIDLIEMLADWKAATERHEDGDLGRSLMVQERRFNISKQLATILENTANEMNWL